MLDQIQVDHVDLPSQNFTEAYMYFPQPSLQNFGLKDAFLDS
jgi:hypothetical protein